MLLHRGCSGSLTVGVRETHYGGWLCLELRVSLIVPVVRSGDWLKLECQR
jgi:hypothetical protein